MRGNRSLELFEERLTRSIPACAGEPAAAFSSSSPHSVYPRVCGGTSGATPSSRMSAGLSPRVRGNLIAGEPFSAVHVFYPRVCGGTSGATPSSRMSAGLSPRVRGNRPWPDAASGEIGSIPACAGEPGEAEWIEKMNAVYPRVCGGTFAFMALR